MGRRNRTPDERAPLVGPLFSWELLRLARRGQAVRSRTFLLVVLLVTYALFGLVWFWKQPLRNWLFGGATLDIKDSAQFADTFVLTILLAQMAVVVVLAPAYGAGVIAEEKERRSLGLLLTTQLTEREVVLGKFLGRVVLLVNLLVAGLPMLMLVQLSGGVDVVFVLTGYALTATTAVLLGAVGMVVGVRARNVRSAMLKAYGFTGVYAVGGCPYLMPFTPHGFLVFVYIVRGSGGAYELVTAAYAGAQLTLAAILVWVTVRRVGELRKRTEAGRPERRRRPVAERTAEPVAERRPWESRADPDRAAPPRRRPPDREEWTEPEPPLRPPRVWAHDPLAWKERYVVGVVESAEDRQYREAGCTAVALALGVVVILFLTGAGAYLERPRGEARPIGPWAAGGMIAVGTWILGAATGAAGSLCRERQRQTLDSLLTLPVDRARIVWAKWRAAAPRGWAVGLIGAVLGLLGFAPVCLAAAGPVAVVAILAVVLFPLIGFAFAVSCAMWLSGRCATTNRAMLFLVPVLVGVVFGPWVWWEVVEVPELFTAGLLLASAGMALCGAWLYRATVRELTGGVP
jgi:ABC-type transport system involved in multi-copper enzyme maturation permease subunit